MGVIAGGRDLARAAIVLLGLCACGVVGSAPAAAATAGGQGSVLSSFELMGTHGYMLQVLSGEGAFPPTVTITAKRKHLQASYEVPGEAGRRIRAEFGLPGTVAVDFQRQKRTVDRPEKGCTYITETGVFHGTFSFAGEGGYTTAEATSIPGEVTRMPNGFCAFGNDRANPRVADLLKATSLTARGRTSNGFVEFGASALHIDSELSFGAFVEEHLGAMTISRSASAAGGNVDALSPDKRTHAITFDPPPPFTGDARFLDPSGGAPTWTGSLSVSLPGAARTALAGPSFAAKFCPDQHLLRKCRVPLP